MNISGMKCLADGELAPAPAKALPLDLTERLLDAMVAYIKKTL